MQQHLDSQDSELLVYCKSRLKILINLKEWRRCVAAQRRLRLNAVAALAPPTEGALDAKGGREKMEYRTNMRTMAIQVNLA
jgi:hypothetical protein